MKAFSNLKNKRAEAYIGTGIKIIIAVVIGALILGGVYALFKNVILPKTDHQVEAMMNTGTDIQIRKGSQSVEYSYDGVTWKSSLVAGTDSTSTVTDLVTIGTGENTVYLTSYRTASGGIVYSSLNGIDWTPIYSDSTNITIYKSGTYVYVNCYDGRQYKSSDGINWQMTSTKRY